jgi:hypothetical protein
LTSLLPCIRTNGALREPIRLSRYLNRVRDSSLSNATVGSGQDVIATTSSAYAHFDANVMAYDFSGDGFITSGVDDVLYARYALGFRGSALTNGLAVGTARTTAQIEAALAACQ